MLGKRSDVDPDMKPRNRPDGSPAPRPRRRARILAGLRASFITGIIVILPISLTIWLLWTVTGFVDRVVLPLVPPRFQPENYGVNLRGVGVVFFLLFTMLVGWVAKGLIGRSLINWAEGLVDRMPVVRSVYSGAKQIAETVFAQTETSFDRACLIEYPRRGIWAIGFISTTAKGEIARRGPDGEELYSVFVPTTPNPTSGFLLYFPKSDVIPLDMGVEDAAKLVISAGLVYPTEKKRPEDVPLVRIPGEDDGEGDLPEKRTGT